VEALDERTLIGACGLYCGLCPAISRRHRIANYNVGRSITVYCTACALLPRRTVERTIAKLEKSLAKGSLDGKDQKAVAKEMRKSFDEAATDLGIDLALRRKRR